MPSIGVDREAFQQEMIALGPDEVRRRLALKHFNEEKAALAEVWLRQLDQEALAASESRKESLHAEQAAAASRAAASAEAAVVEARRAADAAERQATTAERATRIAIAALIVAIVAAILSLIAMVKGK